MIQARVQRARGYRVAVSRLDMFHVKHASRGALHPLPSYTAIRQAVNMADDETPDENDDRKAVDIKVVQSDPEPEPVVDTPDVVVVDTGDANGSDAVDAVVVENAIETAGDLAELRVVVEQLRAENAELRAENEAAKFTADAAAASAELAVDIAGQSIEGKQESPEDDYVPETEHPFFRKWGARR